MGLASGLQLLLGIEGEGGDAARMHRVEVAALITSLSKFGKAITIVSQFEAEIAARSQDGGGGGGGGGGAVEERGAMAAVDPMSPF